MTVGNELITCITITRDRPSLLARAIACFRLQTYLSRELLIVYESDDQPTMALVSKLNDPNIRSLEVPTRQRTLGALRNFATDAANSDLICQWDDDDLYSPQRLTRMKHHLDSSGKDAAMLARWVLYDGVTNLCHFSGPRPWEGSILGRRTALPRYADLARGEDTPFMESLWRDGRLSILDEPELYFHCFHGRNTWDRQHWQRLLRRATPPVLSTASRSLLASFDIFPEDPPPQIIGAPLEFHQTIIGPGIAQDTP